MPPIFPSAEPQTRQACEPCRRKKTKCTAERPTCSYCKRLKIQCSYMPRGRSRAYGARTKVAIDTIPSKESVRGHRVPHIHHLSGYMESSNTAANPHVGSTVSMINQPEASHDMASSSISSLEHIPSHFTKPPSQLLGAPDEPSRFSPARPEPSHEALEHFVDVYRFKLHLQPLPLLCPQKLAWQLITGPRFLLWAFMALTMNFSTHEFYEGQESIAINFYTRLAEDSAMQLVFEGIPTPELAQALCLIALKYIRTQKLSKAWVAIGTASRLEALRTLSGDSNPLPKGDSISRAYWSVFVLERFFILCTSDITGIRVPDYPPSAALPPSPLSTSGHDGSSNVQHPGATTRSGLQDIGINGHSLRIIDIWGKVKCYLHRLRQGMVEKPWSPESTHTRLCVELIEYEAQLNPQYFLCNAALPNRTASEVSQHREYWNPWITSQLLWHACHVTLNHPFIHTFVLRSPEGIPPSCLFLQQRVDLAIYHTGWLFRILEACCNLTEMVDPMIADSIAAASTALWLFRFSRDTKVSQRAQEDLIKHGDSDFSSVGKTFGLERVNIDAQLGTLGKLQALAEEIRRQSSDQDTTISFQPAWFWELLDPRICNSMQNVPPDFNQTSADRPGHSDDSRICLKSHFVMPLDENQRLDQEMQPSDPDLNTGDSLFTMTEDLELFDIDSLSFDFLHNGSWEPAL
ncbi:hypothetical protein NM208_g10269 [Fusarium decemcellulare]|uniref:Uncharacterized protein n=2 Tax=Fusarium decemcellulare TaxID=57161 RepID=A0ACC1RRJ5_9HYPO|nr:hypothetical protein NM208_g12018 [Fusarium decemcellulare]KAJ3528289.1 hypothetical protein NM208_g10269 [Fusarium decemcellulare]